MVTGRSPACFLAFLLLINIYSSSAVWELNRANFQQFRKSASFPIFFVDSPTCSRCRVLYPFFYAASQLFANDREIIFGRVLDSKLVKEWGIDTLPVILYYEKGETEPELLEGDITVDNIVKTISNALPGYIGDIKIQYVIEVNEDNYDEIVKTPKQNVLLLTYNREFMNLREVFETVARAFRFDEQIIVCALDAHKYPALVKKKFGHRTVPLVFWYEASDKSNKYRYGSTILPGVLVDFVNERTNLYRTEHGILDEKSGRIEAIDGLFVHHLPDIYEVDIITTQSAVADMRNVDIKHAWEKDFAEYYVELLERMMMVGNSKIVLKREDNEISEALENEDLTQKQQDFIVRKRNVVRFMTKTLNEYVPARREVIMDNRYPRFGIKDEL